MKPEITIIHTESSIANYSAQAYYYNNFAEFMQDMKKSPNLIVTQDSAYVGIVSYTNGVRAGFWMIDLETKHVVFILELGE